jgi:menaquinol-cytochrome c reductase iron-sulfur subunit
VTEPMDAARRRFLARLSAAVAGLAGIAVGIPVVGFMIAPSLRAPVRRWRPVGRATQFRIGETVKVSFLDAAPEAWSGASAATAAWLRRTSDSDFVAFAINCTHLGCPVRWLPEARLFMCPCHGGVYYADGAVAAGPPPRALSSYPVRVEQGQVFVRTGELPIT